MDIHEKNEVGGSFFFTLDFLRGSKRRGDEGKFKVKYIDSSSSFSLAMQLLLLFQILHVHLPLIWLNIPNKQMRLFFQTSPCLPMFSPALASF